MGYAPTNFKNENIPARSCFDMRYCITLMVMIWAFSIGFLTCAPSGNPTTALSQEAQTPSDTLSNPADTIRPTERIIRGIVVDAKTNLPLSDVRVYFNDSTLSETSTMTKADGSFSIEIDSSVHYAWRVLVFLTFSKMGYVLSGRSVSDPAETLIVQMYSNFVDTTGWLPDDLVPTPGGIAYRANMIQMNYTGYVDTINRKPYTIIADSVAYATNDSLLVFFRGQPVSTKDFVKSTAKTFIDSGDTIRILYRDFISTKSGLIRNNIFSASANTGWFSDTCRIAQVTLQATGLPNGISITYVNNFQGPCGICGMVAKTAIAPEVVPGDYSFAFSVFIDGKSYGSVPCTVRVTN